MIDMKICRWGVDPTLDLPKAKSTEWSEGRSPYESLEVLGCFRAGAGPESSNS